MFEEAKNKLEALKLAMDFQRRDDTSLNNILADIKIQYNISDQDWLKIREDEMIPFKVGMLDFDLKRSVCSASSIIVVLMLLVIFVPFSAKIICLIFGGLAIWMGISMIKEKKAAKTQEAFLSILENNHE